MVEEGRNVDLTNDPLLRSEYRVTNGRSPRCTNESCMFVLTKFGIVALTLPQEVRHSSVGSGKPQGRFIPRGSSESERHILVYIVEMWQPVGAGQVRGDLRGSCNSVFRLSINSRQVREGPSARKRGWQRHGRCDEGVPGRMSAANITD